MKQAVIVAHPNLDSYTVSVANAYRESAEAAGGVVVFRDLYRMGFDPCLHAEEIPGSPNYRVREDVAGERALISDVEAFVLVYPLWLNAPPAILKGYIDRVFGFGFGFGAENSGLEPRLSGRKLLSITSSGAPRHWVVDTGALNAVRTLFDTHLAKVCGLAVLDHIHFGSITPTMTKEAVERNLNSVRNTASWLNRDDSSN
jgi:NAD(P)H dehydrogenase (quinone)